MSLSGFEHRSGVHCGSTALASALRHQGLDLPEPLVFGLGAGLGFSLHDGDTGLTPPQAGRLVIGRSGTFEQDLADALGFELETHLFASGEEAVAQARALSDAGRCVLAYTDLFHLGYLGARGHWFGHLVCLAGFERRGDGEVALVSDNERPGLEEVPVAQLAQALGLAAPVRAGGDAALLTLRGVRPRAELDLARAARRAIGLQAMRMTEDAEASGVIGLSTFPDEVRSWEARADWRRCVRLAGQAMELRGCGGGFFRRLWARGLEETVRLGEPRAAALSPLAEASAAAFTTLALELERAHARETPRLAEAAELARRCVQAERALWDEAARLAEELEG